MSMGGGSNESESTSTNSMQGTSNSWMQSAADAFSQNSSYVDPYQQAYLNSMYGQAMGLNNPGATQSAAYGAQGAMLPGMQQAYGAISGLTDTRTQIAQGRQSLQAGLGNLFQQEIMPGLQSDALASGGFGGGRQGVAEGVAAGQIADSYTAGLGDITARANQTAVGAASQLPGLGQALYNAYTSPTMAGFDSLGRLAQILGAPTILNQGTSQSTSGSASESASVQYAGTESESESSGYNFNFGLW